MRAGSRPERSGATRPQSPVRGQKRRPNTLAQRRNVGGGESCSLHCERTAPAGERARTAYSHTRACSALSVQPVAHAQGRPRRLQRLQLFVAFPREVSGKTEPERNLGGGKQAFSRKKLYYSKAHRPFSNRRATAKAEPKPTETTTAGEKSAGTAAALLPLPARTASALGTLARRKE